MPTLRCGRTWFSARAAANAETLVDWERGIYLLLKAKCDVVADYMGVKKGDFVLKYTGK